MLNPSPARDQRISGFTLIELLITVLIVALLASVAVPMTELVVKRSKEQDLSSNLREIRTAIDAYKQAVDEGRVNKPPDESGYPHSLEVLVAGVIDQKNPKKAKIYFLRRIPRNPFVTNDTPNAADTWGKRSYASDASDPKEGNDVFDVYSKSPDVGLNDIPYREW